MLHFVGYLVIGIIALFGVAAGHLITAERRGYDAIKWHNENMLDYRWSFRFVTWLMMGWLTWPIQIIDFFMEVPDLYSKYDRKDEKIES